MALAAQTLQLEGAAFALAANGDWDGAGIFFCERVLLAAGIAFALPAIIRRAAILAHEGEGGFGHAG